MPKYEFSDNQIRNLLTFLDRAEIKGFHEIQAINDIVSILNNPLQCDLDNRNQSN